MDKIEQADEALRGLVMQGMDEPDGFRQEVMSAAYKLALVVWDIALDLSEPEPDLWPQCVALRERLEAKRDGQD